MHDYSYGIPIMESLLFISKGVGMMIEHYIGTHLAERYCME